MNLVYYSFRRFLTKGLKEPDNVFVIVMSKRECHHCGYDLDALVCPDCGVLTIARDTRDE